LECQKYSYVQGRFAYDSGGRNIKILGRPRRRWVDSIEMDFGEIGWDDMDWLDVAQDRDSGGLLWAR
jgi:hypothetical protein